MMRIATSVHIVRNGWSIRHISLRPQLGVQMTKRTRELKIRLEAPLMEALELAAARDPEMNISVITRRALRRELGYTEAKPIGPTENK